MPRLADLRVEKCLLTENPVGGLKIKVRDVIIGSRSCGEIDHLQDLFEGYVRESWPFYRLFYLVNELVTVLFLELWVRKVLSDPGNEGWPPLLGSDAFVVQRNPAAGWGIINSLGSRGGI